MYEPSSGNLLFANVHKYLGVHRALIISVLHCNKSTASRPRVLTCNQEAFFVPKVDLDFWGTLKSHENMFNKKGQPNTFVCFRVISSKKKKIICSNWGLSVYKTLYEALALLQGTRIAKRKKKRKHFFGAKKWHYLQAKYMFSFV